MPMKSFPYILILVAAFSATTARAASWYGVPSLVVPDGNPNGIFSTANVTGAGPNLLDVRVTLSLSGGYNGDLYGYLSHGGRYLPLLNRIGLSASNLFGAYGNGMEISLLDSASLNIHAAGNGYLSGSYRPDGQAVSPGANPASFSPEGGPMTFLSTFGDLNPNGEWSLFLADVVTGGGPATLNNWTLEITSIPEPRAHWLFLAGIAASYLQFRWKGWCFLLVGKPKLGPN